MDKREYKQGILNVNIWKKGESRPRQYAIHEDEQISIIKRLENDLLFGKIVDYEIYGFADFKDEFTDYGDILYVKKRRLNNKKATA